MLTRLFVFFSVLVLGFSGFVNLIGAEPVKQGHGLHVFHEQSKELADAPTGRLTIRIPAFSSDADSDGKIPTEDASQPPSEPQGPNTEARPKPPTFFGQELGGRFLWVLDVSVSMHQKDVGSSEDFDGNVVTSASRLDVVKYETVQVLKELTKSDAFDFVLLAGMDNGGGEGTRVTETWRGELTVATPEVREQAIDFVMNLETWFGTPTYRALERATNEYGDEIDKLLFLSDGAPIPKNIYNGHIQRILQDFPGWFAPLKENGCELVVFHIGLNANAGTFMQDLASQNSATYIHR